ncbi:hypothetical protein FPY71_15550 [Aureimonas fodinaquatilis]|uniref:Uncharacterized protein n=1 Tax=Aureimonas fodinaquatilis TaxID=2565783 RepID=A0A5B0DTT0_9HYPH|nr:hypothetical protein [Aureimonas fodinaquatilis]KAA0968970.1 hypothetical protein FPY71_15550 [Aureimonas fodinaquatilis]
MVQSFYQTGISYNISLEVLAERLESFRDRMFAIARGLGAHSFSIEFSISAPPGLVFCFHFEAAAFPLTRHPREIGRRFDSESEFYGCALFETVWRNPARIRSAEDCHTYLRVEKF